MNRDIYHIASDYFSGRISESDSRFLQSWIEESKDNKLLLAELKKIWDLTGELSFKMNPDVNAEWERFKEDRNKPGIAKNIKIGKRIEFSTLLKFAAVLIPAVFLLSVAYIFLKNKNTELITINTTTEKKECILPDGSKLWLNKNSNFEYPNQFSKKERIVKLDGEAFFEVVKGKGTFKIQTEKTQVIVVGTEFNVRALKQEKFTEVIVRKGTVIFKDKESNKDAILLAGEKGTFNGQTKELSKEKLINFSAIGWKDEQLIFQDTPLSEIEIVLSRYFNMPVRVTPSLKHCKFTGEFKQAKLEEILKVISISLGATYLVKNDTIFLDGKGCKN